jgi:hypothetical protein
MRGRWLTAVAAVLLLGASAPADVIEVNLKVVGRWELSEAGAYGDVTVIGTTMVVAVEGCGGSVHVLDAKDPAKVKALAAISLPVGATAIDLDSVTVLSETFTGDLLTIALAPCAGGAPTSVSHYDITEPAQPRSIGQREGGDSISVAQRPDKRVLAVRATGSAMAIDDLSDPRSPFEHATWAPPAATGCGRSTAQLYEDGERAVAVMAGGVYALDLIDPSKPLVTGPAEGAGGHVAVLPLGNRTIAVVAEDGSCPPGEPGLRVLKLEPGEPPVEEAPLRYAGAGRPGRLVASGAYAYVAWNEAGLRVVDFAEVRAKTVAQFVPAAGDVVGVALLPEHVVVTDAIQGVFVLERPDEGGGQATFWSQFLSLLPYLGAAVFFTALVLVPRLVAARARSASGVPVPGAERVRRRA